MLRLFLQNVRHADQMEIVHYSRLVPENPYYQPQPELGIEFKSNEFISFWINTTDLFSTAFAIQLTMECVSCNKDSEYQDDKITAKGYILPFESYETTGFRNITLLDQNGELFGQLRGNI